MYKFLVKSVKITLLRVFSYNIYPLNKKFLNAKLKLLNSFHSKNSELTNHIVFEKACLKLPDEIIKVNQNVIFTREIVEYIFENFEEFSLEEEEAADYVLTWFESFEQKTGLSPNFLWKLYANYSNELITQIADNYSKNISFPTHFYKFLSISSFLYSPKTQKEIFQPIVAEWQSEYFEDIYKKRFRRAKFTNLRWTYHFLAAMWMRSPLGDLIEFIRKIAK